MPESPHRLYATRKYDELREVTEYIRRINGQLNKINFKFDTEELLSGRQNRFFTLYHNGNIPAALNENGEHDHDNCENAVPLEISQKDKQFYDEHGYML